MFKMQLIRNAVGSGMVTMMAAMGALGGASFLVSEMMSGNDKVIKKDSGVEAYKQLVDLVRKNLYAGNNCTAALGKTNSRSGIDLTGAILGTAKGSELTLALNIGDSSVVMAPGWRTKTGAQIKALRLKIDNVARPMIRFPGDPVLKNSAYATLYVEPDQKGINIYKKDASGKYIYDNLFIKLFVYYEDSLVGGKQLVSCFDPTSDAAFCTLALGGTYNPDPAVSSDKRCMPDLQCFPYKNGVIEKLAGGNAGCPEDKDAKGNYLYKATQVGAKYVMCNWCNPDPAPIGSFLGLNFQASNALDLDLTDADGNDLSCDANGYSGLSDVEAEDAYNEYGIDQSLLSPEQQAAYSACLNYNPGASSPGDSSDMAVMKALQDTLNTLSEKKLSKAKEEGYIFNYNGVKTKFTAQQVNLALTMDFTKSSATGSAQSGSEDGSQEVTQAADDMRPETITAIANYYVQYWTDAQRAQYSQTGYSYNVNVPEYGINIDIKYSAAQVTAAVAQYQAQVAAAAAAAAAKAEADAAAAAAQQAAIEEYYNNRPTCFVAGTKITMRDGSQKNIEDVVLGEELVTYDESKKQFTASPVVTLFHHKPRLHKLFTFTFSDGRTITSNDNHRIFVVEQNGYLRADQIYHRFLINQSLTLLTDAGQQLTISKMVPDEKVIRLYNLHVNSPYDVNGVEAEYMHNYFANGVLVHNLSWSEERYDNGMYK